MILELHILQNIAPSNLNRDDANQPKDCEFGGHRRARISSLSMKRAIRQEFFRTLPAECVGSRSKLAADRLTEKLSDLIPGRNSEELGKVAKSVIAEYFAKADKDGNSSVLVFFDDTELNHLAEVIKQAYESELAGGLSEKAKKKEKDPAIAAVLKNAGIKPIAYDIALFGRMLAENPDRNVDGACQVSHSISTNRVQMEFDFFTAVDDLQSKDKTGAGMMGTVGFQSSCFYRYAVVHVDKLIENLKHDADAAKKALHAFIEASVIALPSGKQNSFAAHNPPSFVFLTVRDSNTPWSLANAFEKPVRPLGDKGLTENSVEQLLRYYTGLAEIYPNQLNLKHGAILVISDELKKQIKGSAIAGMLVSNLNELLESVNSTITEI